MLTNISVQNLVFGLKAQFIISPMQAWRVGLMKLSSFLPCKGQIIFYCYCRDVMHYVFTYNSVLFFTQGVAIGLN